MFNNYKELQKKLSSYLRRFLSTHEDVEDVSQEAFLRALEAGSKGTIVCPEAYLFRTARNLAFNSLAKKNPDLLEDIAEFRGSDVISGDASPEETVIAQKRFEAFCRAVSELPQQCRQVLVLRKVYGLSQKQVAAELRISTSTVEKHVAKGMLHCRRHLDFKSGTSVERTHKSKS